MIYETSFENLFLLPIKKFIPSHNLNFNEEPIEDVFRLLKMEFDFIVFDASSDTNSKFTKAFVEKCDSAVIVVKKGFSTKKDIAARVNSLKSGKLIGTVLNAIDLP